MANHQRCSPSSNGTVKMVDDSLSSVECGGKFCIGVASHPSLSQLQGSRKRKKRSSSVSRRLLAIGGSHGITMWDVGKNEEVQELVSARVTLNGIMITYPLQSISGSNVVSLAWGGDSIFAADGTSRVIAWDTTTAEYTRYSLLSQLHTNINSPATRWKVDKQGATCVSCNTQGDQLLTAGRSVKLWNTTDQTVIKVFLTLLHSQSVHCVILPRNFHLVTHPIYTN